MLKKIFVAITSLTLISFSTFASEKHYYTQNQKPNRHNHNYQQNYNQNEKPNRHNHNYQQNQHRHIYEHNHEVRRSWNRHDWARWVFTAPVVVGGVMVVNDYDSRYRFINGYVYELRPVYYVSCNCTRYEYVLVD